MWLTPNYVEDRKIKTYTDNIGYYLIPNTQLVKNKNLTKRYDGFKQSI